MKHGRTWAKRLMYGGGISEQCTCHAPNAIRPTERDCMVVSKQMVEHIRGYRVDYDATYPTHWPVQMELMENKQNEGFAKLSKTDSADEAFKPHLHFCSALQWRNTTTALQRLYRQTTVSSDNGFLNLYSELAVNT